MTLPSSTFISYKAAYWQMRERPVDCHWYDSWWNDVKLTITSANDAHALVYRWKLVYSYLSMTLPSSTFISYKAAYWQMRERPVDWYDSWWNDVKLTITSAYNVHWYADGSSYIHISPWRFHHRLSSRTKLHTDRWESDLLTVTGTTLDGMM